MTRIETACNAYWNSFGGSVEVGISAALEAAARWDAEHGSVITEPMRRAAYKAYSSACEEKGQSPNFSGTGMDAALAAAFGARNVYGAAPQPDVRVQRLVEAAEEYLKYSVQNVATRIGDDRRTPLTEAIAPFRTPSAPTAAPSPAADLAALRAWHTWPFDNHAARAAIAVVIRMAGGEVEG